MKKFIAALAVVGVLGLISPAMACDKEGKVVVAGQKSGCCKAKLNNAVAEVMKSLPKMTYKVGDFQTCCRETATAKVGENQNVQFVVNEKTYDDETEAVLALAALLEQRAEELTQMEFAVGETTYRCPMSAKAACKNGQKVKYRLAGFDFSCEEKVDAARKAIHAALNGDNSEKKGPCGGCPEAAKAALAAKKGDCDKAKEAALAAKKGDCDKAKEAALAAKKGDCDKAKEAALAAKKGDCDKAKEAALAAKKGDCDKAKEAALAATKDDCDKSKTAQARVASEKKSGCCKKAEERLATAETKIRTIVEAVATVALSS